MERTEFLCSVRLSLLCTASQVFETVEDLHAVHHNQEQNTQACVGVVVYNDVVHVGNLLALLGQYR
ncbi:hypothetical protein ACLK19_29375 [Escherichia coli]